MTMGFNGTELEEVRFNGVDCEKVYFNGNLVFEKAAGASITVDEVWDNQQWGAIGEYHSKYGISWWVGEIAGEPFPPFGVVVELTWGWDEVPSLGFVRLRCSSTSYTGRLKVTIGSHVRILNKNMHRGDWGLSQTAAQYNELPKSGTHTLKIEAIP